MSLTYIYIYSCVTYEVCIVYVFKDDAWGSQSINVLKLHKPAGRKTEKAACSLHKLEPIASFKDPLKCKEST